MVYHAGASSERDFRFRTLILNALNYKLMKLGKGYFDGKFAMKIV